MCGESTARVSGVMIRIEYEREATGNGIGGRKDPSGSETQRSSCGGDRWGRFASIPFIRNDVVEAIPRGIEGT